MIPKGPLMSPKKSKPKPDDKEQSARFIETAGQVQSDNPKEAFEEAMDKIAKKKRNITAQDSQILNK
ncbi:MAG: hypothetical protein A2Z73_00180 [Deltaproteobacteria bacterium RBG_13_60_28]|nr:MAG: hypothetical protein A2Z73_00180 [Deltaproteobacteria bacterium RBG_13_60_28]